MRNERDLERVFRRDLGRLALPSEERWLPSRGRSSWLRLALAVPLVAAILVGAIGIGRALEERRQPAEPTVAASEAAAVPGFPGVELGRLGTVRGDFVYAARIIPGPTNFGTHELWAVPLVAANCVCGGHSEHHAGGWRGNSSPKASCW